MEKTPKHWYVKWWGILLLLLLTLVLIFVTSSLFYIAEVLRDDKLNPANSALDFKEVDPLKLKLIEGENNYWLGAASPKVTVVEFADYSCPECAKSFPTIREISLKYKDTVKIIFRDYPVINEHSADLALGARCAGEQGFFWPMHDALYINQGISTEEELTELAKKIGADQARFAACLSAKKYQTAIEKDYSDGLNLGVKGTPTWFINGQMIEGNVPYSVFVEILNKMLNQI